MNDIEGAEDVQGHSALSPADHADMKKFGITYVPVDYFHIGEYRYSKLADAIAEAKRRLVV